MIRASFQHIYIKRQKEEETEAIRFNEDRGINVIYSAPPCISRDTWPHNSRPLLSIPCRTTNGIGVTTRETEKKRMKKKKKKKETNDI